LHSAVRESISRPRAMLREAFPVSDNRARGGKEYFGKVGSGHIMDVTRRDYTGASFALSAETFSPTDF